MTIQRRFLTNLLSTDTKTIPSSWQDAVSTPFLFLCYDLNQPCFSVILYYDYIHTFPDEIRYIWSQPKSLGSAWFFAHRYINFFGNIALIVMKYTTHGEQASLPCNSSYRLATQLSHLGMPEIRENQPDFPCHLAVFDYRSDNVSLRYSETHPEHLQQYCKL